MNYLILFAIALPVLSGISLIFSPIKDRKQIYNISTIFTALTLALVVISNIVNFGESCLLLNMPMGLSLNFKVDWLATLFSTLFAFVWFVVSIYNREYFKIEQNEKRYVSFYLIVLGCVISTAYAANPFTFYTCFEAMSITSYTFVLHTQTKESILAAKKYIYYSIFGALCGLIGIMAFYASDLVPTKEFVAGGAISANIGNSVPAVLIIAFISILGFSCKAGMFPMHAWLPAVYPEAPSPASGLLSGIIAKTGIIAILRIVFFVVGAQILQGTWVQLVFLILSIITIFMGSMMAYKENIFKRRLAYSSASQISYAIFGIMMLNPVGVIGALLQVVFHALAKNVLFLCSGNIIYKTNKTKVSELTGLGKAMPATFAFFTIAGISLAGVPFTGGFVSKYYLAQSALNGIFAEVEFIGFIIIMVSALLTGGYILSITAKSLFAQKNQEVEEKCEVNSTMIVPVAIFAILIIAIGIYPELLINVVTNVVSTFGI